MKKLASLFLVSISLSVTIKAQGTKELQARVDTFLQLNKSLNFEKMMDYIYPKLFTVAPREQLIEVFRSAFAGTDEISMEMDSIQTGTISPAVMVGEGTYHLIAYSMLIRMKVKQESTEESNATMLSTLTGQYGENVRYDKPSGKFVITINTTMVAAKDKLSPSWTFLNFDPEHPLAAQLFDEAVITKLKSLKETRKN